MEEGSKGGTHSPQLLNLIPDDTAWKVGEAEDGGRPRNTSFDAEEDKKLELKLGLPGVQEEEAAAGPRGEIRHQQESYPALSLGCFQEHSKLTVNTASTEAKRGFLATVGAKTEGYNQRHQDMEGCGNELTLGGEAGERKKGCCTPSSSNDSAAAPVHSSSNPQGRRAVLPVVSWPPVRSFRRNLTNGNSSKQFPERQSDEAADKAVLTWFFLFWSHLECSTTPRTQISCLTITIWITDVAHERAGK